MYLYNLNGNVATSIILPNHLKENEYIYVDKLDVQPGRLCLDLKNKKYYYIEEIKEPEISSYNILNITDKKIKAITDRSDFIEDCIAEMAGVVYNTEETTT